MGQGLFLTIGMEISLWPGLGGIHGAVGYRQVVGIPHWEETNLQTMIEQSTPS